MISVSCCCGAVFQADSQIDQGWSLALDTFRRDHEGCIVTWQTALLQGTRPVFPSEDPTGPA